MTAIVVSYIIVVSTLLWFSSKGYKFKWQALAFIPLCIWYSIALGAGLNTLLGYPAEIEIPDNAVVRSMHINEPQKGYAGVMCFWMINPDDFGRVDVEPRAYKMPYDRELHKQLMKAKGKKGGIIVWNRLMGSERAIMERMLRGHNTPSKSGEFKVLNPAEFLPKEETAVELGQSKQCDGVCK